MQEKHIKSYYSLILVKFDFLVDFDKNLGESCGYVVKINYQIWFIFFSTILSKSNIGYIYVKFTCMVPMPYKQVDIIRGKKKIHIIK